MSELFYLSCLGRGQWFYSRDNILCPALPVTRADTDQGSPAGPECPWGLPLILKEEENKKEERNNDL